MQHALLTKVQESQMRKDLPVLRIGDTLKVHVKIREGEKERIQIYEGTFIARNNKGVSETITTEQATGHSTEEHRFWGQANIYKVCKDLRSNSEFLGSVVLTHKLEDGLPHLLFQS